MKKIFLLLFVLSFILFALLFVFLRDTYLYDAALHSGLFFLACYLLWKQDLKATLKEIGFPGQLKVTVAYTVGGLAVLFLGLLVLASAALFFGVNDQDKVAQKVSDLPTYLLVLAIAFAPITEELLFRAAMVPRLGVVMAAIVFGVLHITYGSVVEVAGVIIVGVILGYVYKFSKSITPCILIHFTYNLLSIIVMRLFT